MPRIKFRWRRGSPFIWADFTVGEKRIERSTGETEKERALMRGLEMWMVELEKTTALYTIDDLKAAWLEHAKDKRSIKDDEYRFVRVSEYFGCNSSIDRLDVRGIEGFRDWLKTQTTAQGKPYAPATIDRYLALLSSVCSHAVRLQWMETNPVAFVRRPKVNNARDRVCTEREYKVLMREAHQSVGHAYQAAELRAMMAMAYHTGMRLGEICGLRWRDVAGSIISLSADQTKTSEPRRVPVPGAAAKRLHSLPRDSNQVFQHGKDYYQKAFASLVKKVLPKPPHDGDKLLFHDLRHTFCTNAVDTGIPQPVLMKLLGQKDPKMTFRYYTMTKRALSETLEKLDELGPTEELEWDDEFSTTGSSETWASDESTGVSGSIG